MLLLLVAVAAGALEVPYLGGRVNDLAGMLSDDTEAELEAALEALEQQTGAQVVVLTVPSLEGDAIEDFAIRVVETWKLGREGVDDGVLLLITRDERLIRIEVGYGLEGALTDAQSRRIIADVMTPQFRNGDFDAGVRAASEAISAAVRGEELPLPEPRAGRAPEGLPGFGSLLLMALFGLPFINAALSSRGPAGWILYLFLTPFFFAFPAALFGARVGGVAALAWLIGFPILKAILPKGPRPPSGRSGGRGGFGPIWVGGPGWRGGGGSFGGGGFGGGFGGMGGSFGGGGATGGW
jgi:uncharacterized protein